MATELVSRLKFGGGWTDGRKFWRSDGGGRRVGEFDDGD